MATHHRKLLRTTTAMNKDTKGVINNESRNKHEGGDKLYVATWNVRTLYQGGKFENLTQELRELNIDIAGISEVRWTGNGKITRNGYSLYFSGGETHENGVGIIIKEEMERIVEFCTPVSERIIVIKLNTCFVKTVFIQVYVPTSTHSDEECEKFYEKLHNAMKIVGSQERLIIMGDFNAKIGKGGDGNTVGQFGLGKRNQRGDMLVNFCRDHNLIVTNTWFQHPERRLYTWKSPADTEQRIVRNQIDFILINNRFKNNIIDVKTCPSADVQSDHNLLMANMKIKYKNLCKWKKPPRPLIEDLKIQQNNEKFNEEFGKAKSEEVRNTAVEDMWIRIKERLKTSLELTLEEKIDAKKQEWMTEEILALMKERKKYKETDTLRYRTINNQIKGKIKMAKEDWISKRCEVIELMMSNHNNQAIHQEIRKYCKTYNNIKTFSNLHDENNQVVQGKEQEKRIWQQYVQRLFGEVEPGESEYELTKTDANQEHHPFLADELALAINAVGNGKALGVDGIPAEIYKALNEENLKLILLLFNKIYTTGKVPQDFTRSLYIPIPKKTKPKKCEDYRIISLISHLTKIFLKIIMNRIVTPLTGQISELQFGFRKGMGTREAIFILATIVGRALECNKKLYVCFIDYEKAFDSLRHKQLFEILNASDLDWNVKRIITNIYKNQEAAVVTTGGKTNWVNINKGVRQGCILSPLLYNIYSEAIMKDALDECDIGVKINGLIVNNIRYADDTVLLAESSLDLQKLIDSIVLSSEKWNLKINHKKTKVMLFSRSAMHETIELKCNGQDLKQTSEFRYLGRLFHCNNKDIVEVKSRVGQAKNVFMKFNKLLTESKLKISTRVRFLKCYVWSVFLYACEAWTLTACSIRTINAFEMWCYRRIMKVSWNAYRSNTQVLKRCGQVPELLQTIKRRQVSYFGHFMRSTKYEVLKKALMGKICAKRSVGRRRTDWMDNLKTWTGMQLRELTTAPENKTAWRRVVSNIP